MVIPNRTVPGFIAGLPVISNRIGNENRRRNKKRLWY